jgi:hypothetical protein
MYMGTDPKTGDAFKNIDRRHYIYTRDEIGKAPERR